ncbi:MAG TPA: DUF3180 domain-containing protein [Streptosporangiaceae bacterium]|nr:DUF3180 domain-containing protein [Streptosporangiaceae bacterium]
MKPTRLSTLGIIALVCLVVTWLTLRGLYASLPPLPWTGVPGLLAVAAIEAGAGRDLRRRIARKPGTKPPQPLFVSRMVALARASSVAAAIVFGICIGFVGYLGGMLNAANPRHDTISAASTAASALALAAAALYLEYSCRVPDPS